MAILKFPYEPWIIFVLTISKSSKLTVASANFADITLSISLGLIFPINQIQKWTGGILSFNRIYPAKFFTENMLPHHEIDQ